MYIQCAHYYAGIILNIIGPPVEHNDLWWHTLGNGIYIELDLQLGRIQEQGWLSQTINPMQTCVMFSNIQVNTHGSFRFKQEETPFYNFL